MASIHANDAGLVHDVLERYPELRPKLNDTMPGLHFGATPLLAAVPFTNRDMIDALLQAGADINQKSHWWAGGFGVLDDDRGMASFLIERGARVDVHAAAKLGMMDVLERLVQDDEGVVHARGGDGQTPLHVAQTVAVAEWLLNHGADIDARDVDHESTPAQYMIRDRQAVARFLISRGCSSDILMAAALGNLALVRTHLEADPGCIRMFVADEWFPKRDPRAGGCIYIWTLGQLATPHSVAREFGHEEVFQFLMDRTPEELRLALACDLGDDATFRQLLAARPHLAESLSGEDKKHLVRAAQSKTRTRCGSCSQPDGRSWCAGSTAARRCTGPPGTATRRWCARSCATTRRSTCAATTTTSRLSAGRCTGRSTAGTARQATTLES